MSISEITKNWEVSKILVTANANPNYIAFKLGQMGIYAQDFKPIITDPHKNADDLPMVVETRSKEKADTQKFVLQETQFKAYKIFKHGEKFYELEDAVGLAANTMKNILNRFDEPKTFYIDSDSRGLRDLFYNIAVRINDEDNRGHKFDFETYDYRLIIKKYDTVYQNGLYAGTSVFTCLTSKDIPNYWKQM